MRTQRLTCSQQSAPRETVTSLLLDEHLGVVGDHKSAKDGSVSLLSGEAERQIRSLGGLCTARFAANIVTDGLDYASLSPGAQLIIGSCSLEITRVGKPCYEACEIAQSGETCPLPRNCAFSRVLRGGEIHTQDQIMIQNASDQHINDRSDKE